LNLALNPLRGLATLAAAVLVCANTAPAQPVNLSFIDHFNLRQMNSRDARQLQAQVREIERNLDHAKEYGVSTYILFSRSFEGLINYDFAVEPLGDLTGVVYPPGGEHRRKQVLYAECLNEVINYADKLGIKLIFHSNQFDFPSALYKLAGDKLSGTAKVCPGKPLAFALLRGKIREFFAKFPKCAGLELTLSETQVAVTRCKCPACAGLSASDRFVKVAEAAAAACAPLGKTVMIRTWGDFEQLGTVNRLPKTIICSTKFTLPDFHLTNDPNPVMGLNASRQEIEFDGWGEYSGYNLFPCYYGDLFAERIKTCQKLGVPRMAIRLNWNPGVEWIFGKPYGNALNIAVFAGLARDPKADPDALLRAYIAKTFPASASEAAFRLYKRSVELQRVWLTWRGANCNDHSRVYNGGVKRVRSEIGFAVPAGYEAACQALDDRRKAIDEAYAEAKSLVAALGADVPSGWTQELNRAARTQWYVAQSNTDCIQMYAAHREVEDKRPMPLLADVVVRVRSRAEEWKRADPAMFELMLGDSAVRMADQLASPKQPSEASGAR
jgi:hypothetical protein